METQVTTSSGDTRYQAIFDAAAAAQEALEFKVQVESLQVQRLRLEEENKALRAERKALKNALLSAERANPLNENDVRMLLANKVSLHFRLPFKGGAEIKALGIRSPVEVRGSETASLLPQVLRRLRGQLRGE